MKSSETADLPPEVRRILVVDDSQLILGIMRDTLELLPVRVSTVDNAQDALSQLEKSLYDLVLLDVEMPGMTGLEVLDELGRRGFDTKMVIACSGDHSPELAQEMARRNVAFLPKPVEPQTLFGLLEKRWGTKPPVSEATLQNFNGNVALYEKSLGRFLNEYRHWLDVTDLGKEFSNAKDYRFFLHTIKGVSLYVGAEAIVQTVAVLQDAVRQGVEGARLASAESDLLNALRTYLGQLSQRLLPAAPTAPVEKKGNETVEQLRRMLAQIKGHDAEALDTLREVDARSIPDELRPEFQEVARLVLDYEFGPAGLILAVIVASLEKAGQ